jgi:hypothetical protein
MPYDTAPKPKRHRRENSLDDALDLSLFRECLRRWLSWLAQSGDFDRRQTAGAAPEHLGTVYDAAMRRHGRRNDRHADPVLNQLLTEEYLRMDWGASIHAVILDMPKDWRICLLGTALEYSQASIGRELGLRQQLVSVMLAGAKEELLRRVRVLARTRRELRELGWGEDKLSVTPTVR